MISAFPQNFLQWIKQFELASVKKTFVVKTSTPSTGPVSWWFISEAYLEPSQTWLSVFAKIVNRLLVVNYFYKNAPSLISDWILYTPLFIIASCSYSLIQVSLSNCIFLILMTYWWFSLKNSIILSTWLKAQRKLIFDSNPWWGHPVKSLNNFF